MTKNTKIDDVFGISYETGTWVENNESSKISIKKKGEDLKDDVFTEQILNSSPNGKIDFDNIEKTGEINSDNVEKNFGEKESNGEDFFTENFFSNYTKLNNTSKKFLNQKVQVDTVDNTENKKYDKHTEGEYSMFDIKGNLEKPTKEQGILKNVISKPIFIDSGDYGIQMIRQMIETCWKYDKKELANYMKNRVIFKDDSLIAFDKPYFLSYSGKSKEGSTNLDTCLQELKKLTVPDIERFYLVKSLDKQYSGITLFAKSLKEQERYKEMINTGLITFTYRVLVRGIPPHKDGTINFPLVKLTRNKNDIVVKPCNQNKLPKNDTKNVMFASTDFRVIEKNNLANISYLEVKTKNDFPHQIRSHLSYGLNTPLIGDYKYNPLNRKDVATPPKFTNEACNLLDISTRHGYKKVPMLCHLKTLTFPGKEQSSKKPLFISCPMPNHMKYILKKLRLLKK
uniref:Pseudouridylate synthase RPUSD4, mitochondrial n=1 Tax=Strongyloides stercoralis TaxID=6248 RepID=A0A0K0ECE2_STRER